MNFMSEICSYKISKGKTRILTREKYHETVEFLFRFTLLFQTIFFFSM